MTTWLTKSRKIYQRLVGIAISRSVLSPGRDKYPQSKPGQLIKNLTPEEREELKKLTSDDVKSDLR